MADLLPTLPSDEDISLQDDNDDDGDDMEESFEFGGILVSMINRAGSALDSFFADILSTGRRQWRRGTFQCDGMELYDRHEDVGTRKSGPHSAH